MLFPVEFVGRDEKRAPLKTPAWEARRNLVRVRIDVAAIFDFVTVEDWGE